MNQAATRDQQLDAGLTFLKERGFNLLALLSTQVLSEQLPQFSVDHERFGSLLLLGSAGPDLWQQIDGEGLLRRSHPVDTYTRDTVTAFCSQYLGANSPGGGIDHLFAWPNESAREIPVMALGAYAGWQHTSPLGLGLHPVHGLWFAYRAVVLLGPQWPERKLAASENPCDSCTGQPCVQACPVGAVGGANRLDLEACFQERQRDGAVCGSLCLARTACPVGANSRYSIDQVAHHHRFALLAWKKYQSDR